MVGASGEISNMRWGGGEEGGRVWCGGLSESIRINLGIAQQAEGYQGRTEQLWPILYNLTSDTFDQ
jgi:hypothetical protein